MANFPTGGCAINRPPAVVDNPRNHPRSLSLFFPHFGPPAQRKWIRSVPPGGRSLGPGPGFFAGVGKFSWPGVPPDPPPPGCFPTPWQVGAFPGGHPRPENAPRSGFSRNRPFQRNALFYKTRPQFFLIPAIMMHPKTGNFPIPSWVRPVWQDFPRPRRCPPPPFRQFGEETPCLPATKRIPPPHSLGTADFGRRPPTLEKEKEFR